MSVPPSVQDLIDQSGNSFHAKVARWFRDNGWEVSVSPYYMDQAQQKARELDLVVEKLHVMGGTYGDERVVVVTRLFVECKFIPGYGVFWFTAKNRPAVEELLCEPGLFRRGNTYTQKHHYLAKDRVAKLFASSPSRGAQEAEPFYKALNQALNGLVSMRAQEPLSLRNATQRSNSPIVLDFPVVICSSFEQVYAADFDGVEPTMQIRENFQLEVQYAYLNGSMQSRNEQFLIDFVEFNQLSTLATHVEEDAKLAAFFAARS